MNNLLPGFIESAPQDEATHSRIPAGRLGGLDEVAATTAFLLSPQAA